jgi:hypothetical protein
VTSKRTKTPRSQLVSLRYAIAALTGRPHRSLRRHADAAAELRAGAHWLRQPSVQGIGISRKTTRHDRLRALALTVFVDTKLPRASVQDPVPDFINIPGLAKPIRTDVVAVGKLQLHTLSRRPAPPGSGISRIGGASGTLGCLVRREQDDGFIYVLTAGHVLTAVGCMAGDHVLQPGSDYAGTDPECVLARLTQWIEPTITKDDFPNVADAAIAQVVSRRDVAVTIPFVGRPCGRTDTLAIDEAVQMDGFTSGYRTGAVRSLDFCVSFDVQLPDGTRGRAGYGSLVLCTRYASDGDSGAAILNMDRKIVGVHMGGSDSVSYFSRIGYICDELGVEVFTET